VLSLLPGGSYRILSAARRAAGTPSHGKV